MYETCNSFHCSPTGCNQFQQCNNGCCNAGTCVMACPMKAMCQAGECM
jgi:hypothetical protein